MAVRADRFFARRCCHGDVVEPGSAAPCSHFSRLTVAQAEAIGSAVVKRRFKRGEVLVEQGQKSDALYLLLTGRARVTAADSRGREVILATLGQGDYLGEMSIIDNEPHSATVRAEVQTDVLQLERAEFTRCLSENTAMSLVVMRGLVKRLRQADRKIESLALLDVYGRVAHALLEEAETDAQGQQVIRGQGLAPGPGQNHGCLARDGQPRDERPGRRVPLSRPCVQWRDPGSKSA
jgi:CRP/FNR family cyclic AMP-dependent transcriptional regulator